MKHTVRPLQLPPDWKPTPARDRTVGPFRSTVGQTYKLLGTEVEHLGAHTFVLGVDTKDRNIRQDGQLRADAILNGPTIQVFIESRHGSLVYTADRYGKWDDNLRGIALALQALRAVDRYGITRRGEQYRGWTAIDSRPAVMSREQAAEFLAHWAGLGTSLDLFAGYPNAVAAAYRAAAKRAHPDVTGDDGDTMARLNAARDLLARPA